MVVVVVPAAVVAEEESADVAAGVGGWVVVDVVAGVAEGWVDVVEDVEAVDGSPPPLTGTVEEESPTAGAVEVVVGEAIADGGDGNGDESAEKNVIGCEQEI